MYRRGEPPPDEDDEIYQRWVNGKGRILTGAEFMLGYKPPEWIVDGIIQRGRLYACTSLTSHGKTAVWLHIAFMVENGEPVGDRTTAQGEVLYFAGENPDDLQARFIAVAQDHERLPAVAPGHFQMLPEAIGTLRQEILDAKVEYALIILDTAASFFPFEEENSNTQAGEYGRLLRELTQLPGHPAVVVLCHPVKGADKDNLLPRGGGALLNELDANLTLWGDGVPVEITQLHWQAKIRGANFLPLNFRLKPVPVPGYRDKQGREVPTVVAEPVSEATASVIEQSHADDEIDVLRYMHLNAKATVRQIAEAMGWDKNTARVHRALQGLKDDGLVEQPARRQAYRVTPKGKKVAEDTIP
jgi:predicted transcriptional regulator